MAARPLVDNALQLGVPEEEADGGVHLATSLVPLMEAMHLTYVCVLRFCCFFFGGGKVVDDYLA